MVTLTTELLDPHCIDNCISWLSFLIEENYKLVTDFTDVNPQNTGVVQLTLEKDISNSPMPFIVLVTSSLSIVFWVFCVADTK